VDIATAVEKLEEEWDPALGTGFFGKLFNREEFDEAGFERVKAILNSLQISNSETIDRRFVQVIWFIPTFLRWQHDAWQMDGKDTQQLDEAVKFFEMRLTTILGLP
jgi:hypothetical protein